LPTSEQRRQERAQKKLGVYLPEKLIEDLRIVGRDLHDRGLGGNLSDVLRLVLTVCKRNGMLDAAYLTRSAAEFDSSMDLRKP